MYKQASQQRLRITTPVGSLSVEQVWDLSLAQLDALAVSLEEEYKTSNTKSFLAKKTAKNKLTKLKFDIVIDILNTKVEAAEALSSAHENKAHNEKIERLIADKEDESLKGKSVAELKKMLIKK